MAQELKVTVRLENKDMLVLYNHIVEISQPPPSAYVKNFLFLIPFILIISALFNIGDLKNFLYMAGISLSFLAILILLKIIPFLLHRLTAKMTERSFMKKSEQELQIEGVKSYVLLNKGVEIRSVYGDLLIKWEDILNVNEDKEYIFIDGKERKGSHIIPKKFFMSKAQKEDFLDELYVNMAHCGGK